MRDDRNEQATDERRHLERATHEAGAEATGTGWDDRQRAVESVRSRLAPRLETLNASRVEAGVAHAVTYDRSAASVWARANCPRGAGRRFGPCRAVDGVVLQERAGETTVLAVGYDVRVTTSRGERRLTFVVRVVG